MSATKYEYRRSENELATCDCCRAVAPLHSFERRDFIENKSVKDNLCEVCASTMIANAWTYPSQHKEPHLFTALGFCTNLILDAVTGRRPK